MDMTTEIGILLTYSFVIFAIYFFGYIFLIPMKFILKILLNSSLGVLFLILFNFIGGYMNFHIPINIISALVVGLLGLPGTATLLFVQIM